MRRPVGAGTISPRGYHILQAGGKTYKVHRLVADAALGRPLARNIVVHHVDENPANNVNSNLIVCSQTYHQLLHQRMSAMEACGYAHWRKCQHCQRYDDPLHMQLVHGHAFHRACKSADNRERHLERTKSQPKRGRARGELHGCAKLTSAQVCEIRLRRDQSQREIAAEFGVAKSTIGYILSGKIWASI